MEKLRASQIRVRQKMPPATIEFVTQWNGLEPLRVAIAGKKASIFSGKKWGEWDNLEREFAFRRVFIGNGNFQPRWDRNPPELFIGATALFELSPKRYLYVCGSICEFTTPERIVSCFSQVENNNVPYPVALGKRYAYFFDEFCAVPRNVLDPDGTKTEDWWGRDSSGAYQNYVNQFRPPPPRLRWLLKRPWPDPDYSKVPGLIELETTCDYFV